MFKSLFIPVFQMDTYVDFRNYDNYHNIIRNQIKSQTVLNESIDFPPDFQSMPDDHCIVDKSSPRL